MKPAEKFCPAALAAMSQSAFGIVWLPPVAYGPWTLSLTGPFSCLMPSSLSVTSRSMRAVLIGVENALSSVALTSSEPPLPHALRSAAERATQSNANARKRGGIGGQSSGPPLMSAQDGPKNDPLHGQGRRRQDQRGGSHRAQVRRRRPAHDRPVDGSGALAVGFARGRARERADRVRRPALGPGGAGPGRDGEALGVGVGMARRAARRARRRPDLGGGADPRPRPGTTP